MFANLIESDTHRQEFTRRSSFFLATVAAYALILCAAGIAGIYAYDARLESQNADLALLSWVPTVTPATANRDREPQPVHRLFPSVALTDRHITIQERTTGLAPPNDPLRVPNDVGTKASPIPPVTGFFKLGSRNIGPIGMPSGSANACPTCAGSTPVARVPDTTPPPLPTPVKPKTQVVTSVVLTAKAISIPKPAYPPIAKQIHAEGAVAVQILVDENGKVISARALSGHPTLTHAAVEAAYQARFTPTTLNGQPVKVQGVITYNFVLH